MYNVALLYILSSNISVANFVFSLGILFIYIVSIFTHLLNANLFIV